MGMTQVVQILGQGVCAALTGGWYHDPDQSILNNSCHLYLWIILMMLPITLHLGLPSTTVTLLIYGISTAIFFTVIKFGSYHLHHMLDKGNIVQGHDRRMNGKLHKENEEKATKVKMPPVHVSDIQVSSSSTTTSSSHEETSGDMTAHVVQQHVCITTQVAQSQTPQHPCQAIKESLCSESQQNMNKKQIYKCIIFPGKWIEIWYDRLALLALLDRSEHIKDNIYSVLLAVLVSLFGFSVLNKGFCKDLWLFQFCFVMSSCQYSLIKSVQPDPASPVHGYNKIIAYSRPFYFSILCGLILMMDSGSKGTYASYSTVYGLKLFSSESLTRARDHVTLVVYCFPAISLLGLFPQINTFCTYILEQIDMLLFGGSAAVGVMSALYSVSRSLITVAVLHIFCFGALKKPWDAHHIPMLFSAFCGLLVGISYHLSRQSSDPSVLVSLIWGELFPRCLWQKVDKSFITTVDPLPESLKTSVKEILKSDFLISMMLAMLSFAVTSSTVFLSLRPFFGIVLFSLAGIVGLVAHYIIPQLRKHHPWLCISHSILQGKEYRQRDVTDAAQIVWFEKLYICLESVEKYILYPAIILNELTIDAFSIAQSKRLEIHSDITIITVAGMKLLRLSFSNPVDQFLTLCFTVVFLYFDYSNLSGSLLLGFFIMTIVFNKIRDLLHKLQFVLSYVAPWQLAWGSSFHVFAQFLAIPHSAMLFFQAVATSIFSVPLSPFLGSVIFITSYARPIKFWENKYNKRDVDYSNTRMAYQIEKDPGNEDNNLNSIFYEHLTQSLQESLCGDLALGRWGNYRSGDCFILTSDDLSAFVHLIEIGNGFITFQLRGLEFRGTYCQQRELEAITGDEDDGSCCCCRPGHLPHMLSHNAAFNLRWLTWEVTREKYILDGYRIINNNAATMLQLFDLRKVLIKYYIKCIIYLTTSSPKLLDWINDESIQKAIQPYARWKYIERDLAFFNINIDEDYIPCLQGITRASFCNIYLDWIRYCVSKRREHMNIDEDSGLVTLTFALSILGRRALGTAAHHMSISLDSFLHGLHSLFKGDFQITPRDEWIFVDMDLLHTVVVPAIRLSLKLHQDHFACSEEYEDCDVLYKAILSSEGKVVICHEGEPTWRASVLSNKEELLTLRHVVEEGTDQYKVIMLHRSYLSFKVIKVNEECVRGLWAGQQQELIFLRNSNPERGSIQNNTQVLRNLINSSCDQPLGYPLYVSPLTTSYTGTHEKLRNIWGRPIHLNNIMIWLKAKWLRVPKEGSARWDSGGTVEHGGRQSASSSNVSETTDSQRSFSQQIRAERLHVKNSSQEKKHQYNGRGNCRSQSLQTNAALKERPLVTSQSAPIMESQYPCFHASTSAYDIMPRFSSNKPHTSFTSVHSQVSKVSFSCELIGQENPGTMHRSSPASSTNSTLSLLFGKKNFSSAFVISGLSAADGGNTTDTQSSSSVNIINIAIGPSARAGNNAGWCPIETFDIDDATELDDFKDESPDAFVMVDKHIIESTTTIQKEKEQEEDSMTTHVNQKDEQ
ncbi:pecanex-like protein 2 isoform X2 [Ambystoma mexicanum]|uniref:pecanex-like protein 2 isoform X2 n=1 Tax=Ambystoma mexicanum TaxID=8296 RepID=UPI0037E8DB07